MKNDNKQELNGEIRLPSFDRRSNRFDDRFLNSRRKRPATSAQTIQNQIENLLKKRITLSLNNTLEKTLN